MRVIIFFWIMCLSTALNAAGIRMELNETTIRGSSELPRVTYVVPWREFSDSEVPDWPIVRGRVDAQAPIDRDVFRRYIDYYQLIKDDTGRLSRH